MERDDVGEKEREEEPMNLGEPSNVHQNNTRATTRGPEIQRPPPIHASGKTLQEIADLLSKIDNIPEVTQKFYLRQPKQSNEITIISTDIKAFKQFKQTLTDNDIKYYSYTPKHEKPKTIVLKGIFGDFDEVQVREDLMSRKFKKVEILKVNKIIFNKKTNNFGFIVQTTNTSDINEITKIKTMLYQKVSWEQLRRNSLFQCKKCQRFGHAASNCTLPPRCVKCGEGHDFGKCLIVKNSDRLSLKCANCEQVGHPANYRGCPFFKDSLYIINRNKRDNYQQNNEMIKKVSRRLDPNLSFAGATRSSNVREDIRVNEIQHDNNINNQLYSRHIPSRENVRPITVHNHENENEQSTPSWVDKLQSNIINAVQQQFNGLKTQVEKNTQDIQMILDQLNKKSE